MSKGSPGHVCSQYASCRGGRQAEPTCGMMESLINRVAVLPRCEGASPGQAPWCVLSPEPFTHVAPFSKCLCDPSTSASQQAHHARPVTCGALVGHLLITSGSESERHSPDPKRGLLYLTSLGKVALRHGFGHYLNYTSVPKLNSLKPTFFFFFLAEIVSLCKHTRSFA